jgi:ABC-2 type transport system permease protein
VSAAGLPDLVGTEFRLLSREWAAMVFAFVFPPLLMLILGGVFGSEPSPEYGGVTPAEYYVADYLAVPLGALALIGLPVMLASYRERGVLRRFSAFGVPVWQVVAAQAIVTAVLVLLGAGIVLAAAAPTYGVPAVQDGTAVLAGFAVGSLTMIALGAVLGLIAPTARAAQALGLLAFFPMWLLGAGGPPRPVMPEVMGRIADVLPLGRVAAAVREPWLGTGSSGADLAVVAAWLVGAAIILGALLARRAGTRLP